MTRNSRAEKNESGSLIFVLCVFVSFISAYLLFAVQPMFTRMALPYLGGAPNVWNTAMVFFQAMLLLGYLYTHFLRKWASLLPQIGVHGFVLTAALFSLPITIPDIVFAERSAHPTTWLLVIFALGVGAPFFALSATAPLIQHWFASAGHRLSRDPYFLYAGSNAGSMIALLSYPFVIEPLAGIQAQSKVWAAGYGLLALSILTTGYMVFQKTIGQQPTGGGRNFVVDDDAPQIENRLTLKTIGLIIALTLAPSGLMLTVTSDLTIDIASTPILWITPFSLYLLTFILAFSSRERTMPISGDKAVPLAFFTAMVMALTNSRYGGLLIAGELFIFFIVAFACHARLAALRPRVQDLTGYYIAMSIGGVLGGLFTAIISPLLFSDFYEYPILMALASLLIVGAPAGALRADLRVVAGAIVLFTGLISVLLIGIEWPTFSSVNAFDLFIVAAVIVAALYFFFARRSALNFFAGFAGFAVFVSLVANERDFGGRDIVLQERSFYGVVRVLRAENNGETYHSLLHGTTLHNHQLRAPALQKLPLAYYAEEGPFGDIIRRQRTLKRDLRMAVIGLGAGAVACYRQDAEDWDFFEIDPMIVRIAKDPAYFSFLSNCAPDETIHVGDARLELAENERLSGYDVIIVDAFSSDSIPTHLITREALNLYQERLAPGGVVLFHTSNRVLDVTSVAVNLAYADDLGVRVWKKEPDGSAPFSDLKSKAIVVAIGDAPVIDRLITDDSPWQTPPRNPGVGVWTDDYSNIFGAYLSKRHEGADAAQKPKY